MSNTIIEVGDRVSFVSGKYHFTGKIDSLHFDCPEPWAGIRFYSNNVACWTWRSLDKLTKLAAPAAAGQESTA